LWIVKSIIEVRNARSLSFPKTRRLSRTWEFDLVKKSGHTERGKFMMLSVLAMQNPGPPRVGFITSGRLGSAVVRNRVRRRLREIVRKHQHGLRKDFWIVLIARSDGIKASYSALEDEWLRLAKRASILAL
jgi:ribonuclease P protein component